MTRLAHDRHSIHRVLGPGDALAGRTVDDADLATLVEPPAIPTFGNPGLLSLGFALLLSGVLHRRGLPTDIARNLALAWSP